MTTVLFVTIFDGTIQHGLTYVDAGSYSKDLKQHARKYAFGFLNDFVRTFAASIVRMRGPRPQMHSQSIRSRQVSWFVAAIDFFDDVNGLNDES